MGNENGKKKVGEGNIKNIDSKFLRKWLDQNMRRLDQEKQNNH